MGELLWPPEIRAAVIGAILIIIPAVAALGKAKLDALRRDVEAGHAKNAQAISELRDQLPERSTPDG